MIHNRFICAEAPNLGPPSLTGTVFQYPVASYVRTYVPQNSTVMKF